MTASRRDHLVKTAVELFRRNGYHATGIEKILKESGVSKPTLYRHFSSKDELIIAALRAWDVESRGWLCGEMERRADTPRGRVLALFDALADWFQEPGFQGCMFINATVEFAEQDNPIHQAAAEHKRLFAHHVRTEVAAAGVSDPQEITEELMILMEGAIVTAHTSGRGDAARRARKMAEAILAGALD
ncbi:MAG: TetR/AcrR family transcriptional regulator [Sphingomonadales bacterium]|nr:TetR/AcrR family transcriptional regulator [Sphingomonadales bacterium]